jgi:pimeloyl-ACP methyl ester carboxylesterase
MECGGGPGPTVVFEEALGGDRTLWPIAERIREHAYACVYDRPGDGNSAAPDVPQTARADVADLHHLLEEADIPRPVVLVGHSYGGLIAWMAAVEHPDDVAGVVLIDASHPDQTERWEAMMNGEQRSTLRASDADFPYVDFQASLEEAATEYGSLPGIPLTVITATRSFVGEGCIEGLPCEAMQAIWLELQDGYAKLRPDARHVKVPTGHYVHNEDPDLVVDEILRLVAKVDPEYGAYR